MAALKVPLPPVSGAVAEGTKLFDYIRRLPSPPRL